MDNNNEHGSFVFSYSAREQEEVKRIRKKYVSEAPSDEDRMARLRRLDNSATQKAQVVSLVLGVIGTLLLGLGMSLIMTDLANLLGSLRGMSMPIGIAVGVVGGTLAALAYPTYNRVLARERKRIAPEIIKLTDELLK